MSKLNTMVFRGVTLRYFDGRRKEESMPFVRLHLTADVSVPVFEEMQWAIGEGVTSGKLSGRLSCSHLILTPNEKGLKQYELQLEIAEASDFDFVAPGAEPEEGAAKQTKLRFIVRSNQADAAARVEAFWRGVGASDSQLRLSYQREPQQQTLAAAAEESSSDDEFANADQPRSPALASAQEMKRKRAEADRKAVQ